jgi:hypothetical protein
MDDEQDDGVLVEGVTVVAGETARDPRLTDIDLRAKARVLTFRIVDENGAPIEDGTVAHRAPGAAAWNQSAWIESGEAHLFTLLDEVDVYVSAEGRRAEFVPRAKPETPIVLGPGIPVRFVWGETAERSATIQAFPALVFVEPGFPEIPIDLTVGTAESDPVYMGAPGAYQVRWTLLVTHAGLTKSESLDGERFVLLERSEPQLVRIDQPAELRARIDASRPSE